MKLYGSLLIPTVILLWGLIEDLRSRKVPNRVVLICALFGILNNAFYGGWSGLGVGLLGGGTALALLMPLVLFGMLGAGDMKLMIAFGFSYNWQGVLVVSTAALLWGALMGVARAIFAGQGLDLVKNTVALVGYGAKVDRKQMHSIPYTAALLFGWFTHLTFQFYGVAL